MLLASPFIDAPQVTHQSLSSPSTVFRLSPQPRRWVHWLQWPLLPPGFPAHQPRAPTGPAGMALPRSGARSSAGHGGSRHRGLRATGRWLRSPPHRPHGRRDCSPEWPSKVPQAQPFANQFRPLSLEAKCPRSRGRAGTFGDGGRTCPSLSPASGVCPRPLVPAGRQVHPCALCPARCLPSPCASEAPRPSSRTRIPDAELGPACSPVAAPSLTTSARTPLSYRPRSEAWLDVDSEGTRRGPVEGGCLPRPPFQRGACAR